MIKYKLKNTNITNTAGDIIYIEDVTGEYSEDNPTGYGGPNQLREEKALFLVAYYKGSKGDLRATIRNYDVTVDYRFQLKLTSDGWYRINLLAFDLYDESLLETYTVGDIFYQASTGFLLRIDLDPDLGFITTKVELNDLLGKDLEVESLDVFIIYNSCKVMIRLNSMVSDLLTNNVDFSDKRLIRLKDNYDLVRAITEGASYEFCRGNKATAQKNIEFLNNNSYVSE